MEFQNICNEMVARFFAPPFIMETVRRFVIYVLGPVSLNVMASSRSCREGRSAVQCSLLLTNWHETGIDNRCYYPTV